MVATGRKAYDAGMKSFEIFLIAVPGLEDALCAEARDAGFSAEVTKGGVVMQGSWPDIWRANLVLRGASAVLARIGTFPASHLSELDKRARKFPWGEFLSKKIPLRVSASCRASRIYHSGAVQQRIENALREEFGAVIDDEAAVEIMARIERNICTLSIDTSGTALHKRGNKEAMAKAPLRETMAALFLRECGYRGTEPVLDPMCGSGTFILEAAEMALGLMPGRKRSFTFENLPSFDPKAWQAFLKQEPQSTEQRFWGFDRDAGAIKAAAANAARAGVDNLISFKQLSISALTRPDGPPGLVISNPPYGLRIGDVKKLSSLYASFGQRLRENFAGWRVGLITNEPTLAKATGLPFLPPSPPVLHGGIKIKLYQTKALL